MSETVESVARAIWAERQISAIDAGLMLKEWDDEMPLFREEVRREARAAIREVVTKAAQEGLFKLGGTDRVSNFFRSLGV